MTVSKRITAERVRAMLHYDPETGILTWLVGQRIGKRAGSIGKHPSGYLRRVIHTGRVLYSEHRIVWLYMTGEWPSEWLDHRNGDATDNRWSNLRLADKFQNATNARWVPNKTGFKGVTPNHKKFQANIRSKNVNRYLGTFDTAEEAAAAYAAAALQYHGEFARTE